MNRNKSPQLKKRISLKNLFFSMLKFQKVVVNQGVYLACLFLCEDKVLVTNDDLIPIIEVDESCCSSSIQNDLYWLMKVDHSKLRFLVIFTYLFYVSSMFDLLRNITLSLSKSSLKNTGADVKYDIKAPLLWCLFLALITPR